MFGLEKPSPLTNQYYSMTVDGTARIQSESAHFLQTQTVKARRGETGSCTTQANNN